ncbi:MAG: class I SAM-dependent methyltransferase [Chloroflexia bacterium]
MADTSPAKKLGIKPGHKLLIMSAPEGYISRLDPLPEGADVFDRLPPGEEGTFDFVHVFAQNRADVERHAPEALQALKPGGLLWFSYPKGSSKVKTDISRDKGWESITGAGMEIIAQVSIDDTWSAGRFRPSADVKSRKA